MTLPAANRPAVEEAGGQFPLLDIKRPGEALLPPRMTDLNQPEIPGPGGAPVEIPDDLYQRIRADLEAEGGAGGGFEPLEGLSEAAKLVIRNFESRIRVLPREHLRVFSPDGIERYRRTGDSSSVGLDLSTLPGNVATHNHPGGMPPSLRDVIVGMEGDALEIRVVTAGFDYAIRFADASPGDIVMHWSTAQQAAIAVAREWTRSNPEIAENEAYARGYHAGFMELARRGILKYVRTANV